ncbi:MAG: aa3-type cytochrome c oxidase subunit IV [Proteobacteria bacterium]|nr:aa3-type cytochrome c oxidase subunit IV [Pseudomonadota bacterium]
MSDTHDTDYDDHSRMWYLFTRLVTIGVGVTVSVLVLMAITLL